MAGIGFNNASRSIRHQTYIHPDARGTHPCDASSGDFRVRIDARNHHAPHLLAYEQIRTRRCPSLVAARFQSDIHRGTRGVAGGHAHGHNLGMVHAIVLVPSVTDDLAAVIARAKGVHVHETLTGFKHICGDIPDLAARGYTYVMGYEESIGYAVGTLVRDKDGLSGGLLLCRAAAHLRRKGETLWDLLTGLWNAYGYHAARPLNLVREGLDGQAEIAAILAAFREHAPRQVGNVRLVRSEDLDAGTAQKYGPDGTPKGPPEPLGFPRSNVLRFFFGDGSWYAVRPSGTEPKLKIYLYAVVQPSTSDDDDGEDLDTLLSRGEDVLDQMYQAIKPLLGE